MKKASVSYYPKSHGVIVFVSDFDQAGKGPCRMFHMRCNSAERALRHVQALQERFGYEMVEVSVARHYPLLSINPFPFLP